MFLISLTFYLKFGWSELLVWQADPGFFPKGAEFLVALSLLCCGCCSWQFTMIAGYGNTRGTLGLQMHFSLPHCLADTWVILVVRVRELCQYNHSFIFFLVTWNEKTKVTRDKMVRTDVALGRNSLHLPQSPPHPNQNTHILQEQNL